jgi:hypothetical protein
MPGELWEIVPVEKLKIGDMVSACDCEGTNWRHHHVDAFRGTMLTLKRRYIGHHPDVLMRVIENMHSEIRGWNEVGDYPSPTDSIDKYIAEAEAEIAKEQNDAK